MALTEGPLASHAAVAQENDHSIVPKALDFIPLPPEHTATMNTLSNGHVTEVAPQTNGSAATDKMPYVNDRIDTSSDSACKIPLNDQLAYTPRKLRVVTVGAGFSGLMMAHKFQHRFPELDSNLEHTIFEKRHEVGGTWLVNTYPGVQCDVPSHIYAFPFDPNPEWTRFYSSGAEIQEYILRTTRKWNLDRDVQLNTRVIRAVWQNDQGQWKITTEKDGQQQETFADVLINGQGPLDTYRWPDIPGLESFKGVRNHSANWDHSHDYSHKRIGVIGNGSSGIQLVPQLARLPGTTVTNFARGPSWIYYRVPPSQHLGDSGKKGNNPEYTEEEKIAFRTNPDLLRNTRRAMINRTNKAFKMFIKDSEGNEEAMTIAEQQMRERLNHDPELCRMLIPDWSLGCRRITPGEGYLESFRLPNCTLTQSSVTHISEHAIHTADGKVHEVDVLVCATGFDVSFRPNYPTIGLHDIDLRQAWTHSPESYFSIAAANMPNYFTVLGPNALAGHGSLLEAMNWNGDYFCRWIKKLAEEDVKSFVPKTDVVEQLVKYSDEIHKRLVWTAPCKSWYKQGTVDGRVTALFAGSGMLYKRIVSGELRTEDFDIEYRSGNRFKFMGNGFTALEMDPESDLAWYIEK